MSESAVQVKSKRELELIHDAQRGEPKIRRLVGGIELRTSPERSLLMARVKQSGTADEIAVRNILRSAGIRFSTNSQDLPGRPDLVDRKNKWAIFVHGCFWHAHSGCRRWKLPRSNRSFWRTKFRVNRQRDKKDTISLESLGYSVLVVWECELDDRKEVAEKIIDFLRRRIFKSRLPKPLLDGPREAYRYQRRGVVRTVSRRDGRRFSTRIPTRVNGSDPRSDFDYAYLRQAKRPRPSNGSQTVRVVDLFSGCGGLSLGSMEACRALGFRFLPVMALDNDRDCMRVYDNNFGCLNVYTDDITRVLNGDIGGQLTRSEKEVVKKTRHVTMLLAGPPCQGNSDLNNHTRREDPRNVLYERVARFVEIAEPEHIIIEDVPPAVHGKERAIQKSIEVLAHRGYHVDTGIVDLSRIGVPQKRRRHVLVASKSKRLDLSDVIQKYEVKKPRSVKWAIHDLAHEGPNEPFTTSSKHTKSNLRRIRYLHEKALFELPNRLRPTCHRSGKHSYKSMYGRLRPIEPAQTITSGFGSPGQGRYVHPTQLRTITPHEAARLQSFPDFFDFSSTKSRTALASMIGNAAPMKLSYVLGLELLS